MLSLSKKHWLLFLSVAGPGIVVMFADTDASSVIVAAQSGAVWGYHLLILQIILIPILFIAQELTVRLGLVTGMGHGELIKKRFGIFWAWLSVGTLLVCCIGAIITELSGLSAVGSLFGINLKLTVTLVVLFLVFVAWSGSYHSVEKIALCIGAFELIFIAVAFMSKPEPSELVHGMLNLPLANSHFLYMMAANIGAVIMPWMVFYQQSAVLDKGLGVQHLTPARWDTLLGAIVTQAVMASVLIATAATIGKTNPGAPLNDVHQISEALIPSLGVTTGKILFALGMMGASLVAAIVVSLTAAWGLGEIIGYKRSLSDHPAQAPWFYGIYTLVLVIGGLVVASGINLVNLNVAVDVMNALLLPIVLGFLYLLALKALPDAHRLKGNYAIIVGVVLGMTALFGVYAGITGIFGS